MAFVYKYVDHEGTPVYIGIVKGDFYTNLDSRIGQHFSQDSWRDEQPNCKIFYIEGLTGADADAIETILCAKYHPKHNGAKMNWGPTELGVLEDFLLGMNTPSYQGRNPLPLRSCRNAGKDDAHTVASPEILFISAIFSIWETIGKFTPGTWFVISAGHGSRSCSASLS